MTTSSYPRQSGKILVALLICCSVIFSPFAQTGSGHSMFSNSDASRSERGAKEFFAFILSLLQGGGPPSVPGPGLPDLDTTRAAQQSEPIAPAAISSTQACTDCTPCPTCGRGGANHAPVVSAGGPYYGTAGVPYAVNPRPKRITISDSEGNRRQTSIEYTSYGLPAEVFEQGPLSTSDWAILRRTHTDYDLSPAYVNRHILGLVQGQYLFAPDAPSSPSVQTLMSKTTYEYDVNTGICTGLCADYAAAANSSAIVQHDGANYGSGFIVGRGALTRVRRWDAGDEMNESKRITSLVHYNSLGSAIRSSDPLGHQTTIGYTDQFSVNGTIVANPSVVTMAYPTTVTDPDSFSSSARYQYELGMVTRKQDPKGAAQTTQYDSAGRVKQVTNAVNGAYSRLVYPASQTILVSATTVNDLTHETFSFSVFDGAGRVRATAADFPDTMPHYSAKYTAYDVLGRAVSQSNPIEITSGWIATGADAAAQGGLGWIFTTQTYDWKGRPRTTTHPDTTTKEASYGGCGCAGGEVVTLTDEGTVDSGVTRRRQQKIYSDSLGRMSKTEVLNWQGGSVYSASVNTYNARDQVTLMRQFQGTAPSDPNDLSCPSGTCQQTTMSLDGYGRLKTRHAPEQQVDPNNGASTDYTTWDYNPDDTIKKITDARGVSRTFGYNARRQVTSIAYPLIDLPAGVLPTHDVSYEYDAAGNRITMSDGLGSASYTYDQLSRLTSETRTITGVGTYPLNYAYNLSGELTSLTDPFGAQVGYNYDATGRTTTVTGAGFGNVSTYASNLKYRAWGALKSLDYGNTNSLSMTYNSRMQPATFTIPNVMIKSYDYEADGRLRFSHDLGNPKYDRSYAYNHAGRLTEALSGGEARNEGFTTLRPYKETFVYDAFGHLQERPVNIFWSQPGGAFSPGHQTYQNERNVNWQYDADGQLTHSGDVDYTIDAAGRNTRIVSQTTIPYNGNPYSTITSVTNELTQSPDGDGAALKQVDVETTHDPTAGDDTTTATTYQVRSSVLGGKVVTEISPQASRGFVYLGNEVLAWQSKVGTTETVKWEHRDPQNASFRLTRDTGSIDASEKAELDPLGTNAGTSDPTTVPSMKHSLYPAFGASQGSSDAQCNIDGMLSPCSRALHTVGIGAGTVERSHLPGDANGSIPHSSPVWIPDDSEDKWIPDPGSVPEKSVGTLIIGNGGHFELVPDGWVDNSLQPRQPQNPVANPFPTLGKDNLKVVTDSIKLAKEMTDPKKHKECDEALKAFGIPSLSALINGMTPNGNLFDGRTSTLIGPIGKNGATQSVAAYFKENKTKIGAAVFDSSVTGGASATFLGDYFFNPPIENMWQQRAIMLIHEAVHQVGGKGDAPFGGSKQLSEKIIEKCYPVLKGKLGGVG